MSAELTAARQAIEQSLEVQRGQLEPAALDRIITAAGMIASALETGGKLILFGNGGSAADASHLAAEFVGRFAAERRALPAVSLSTDLAAVTAIANDYGYERVFVRQLEALGRPGDVAVALSTSGRSPNVVGAARRARELGLSTIGMTGAAGGELERSVGLCLTVDSAVTARVQEGHILIGHVLCELVERRLC